MIYGINGIKDSLKGLSMNKEKDVSFDYDVPFPVKKIGDVEAYVCYQHGGVNGLIFPVDKPELAMLHYSIDHLRKTKRKFGYSCDLKT